MKKEGKTAAEDGKGSVLAVEQETGSALQKKQIFIIKN